LKTFKKYIISSAVLSTCMLMLMGDVIAGVSNMPPTPSGQHQYTDITHFTEARLQSLKEKLDLDPSQISAWNTWSSGVISDVKKQNMEDQKVVSDWMDEVPENTTTPEKLAHQEEHLRHHIMRMQNQLNRLEAARLNAITFYTALNKSQKTIFDLFWQESAFHHRSIGH